MTFMYSNWNTFDSKWAVVLPGQFAGTFAGPDTYWLSFILVVNSFDSSLECTRLNCWHRSPRAAVCLSDCSFVKPVADPSVGVSRAVSRRIAVLYAFQTQLTESECGKVLHGRVSSQKLFNCQADWCQRAHHTWESTTISFLKFQ